MQAAAEINRRAPQLLHPRTARVLETIRYVHVSCTKHCKDKSLVQECQSGKK